MLGGSWIKKKIQSFLKIFIIFLTSIFLPKIFLLYTAPIRQEYLTMPHEFQYGLENIPPQLSKSLKNPKIGLITNATGKDSDGKQNIDILQEKDFKITKILVPEHGLHGNIPAGKKVNDNLKNKNNIPIISLYSQNNFKEIDPKKVNDLDAFIFDIQDSGMRHYTYISTLYKILDFASKNNKKVIVLDRPNPLGKVME